MVWPPRRPSRAPQELPQPDDPERRGAHAVCVVQRRGAAHPEGAKPVRAAGARLRQHLRPQVARAPPICGNTQLSTTADCRGPALDHGRLGETPLTLLTRVLVPHARCDGAGRAHLQRAARGRLDGYRAVAVAVRRAAWHPGSSPPNPLNSLTLSTSTITTASFSITPPSQPLPSPHLQATVSPPVARHPPHLHHRQPSCCAASRCSTCAGRSRAASASSSRTRRTPSSSTSRASTTFSSAHCIASCLHTPPSIMTRCLHCPALQARATPSLLRHDITHHAHTRLALSTHAAPPRIVSQLVAGGFDLGVEVGQRHDPRRPRRRQQLAHRHRDHVRGRRPRGRRGATQPRGGRRRDPCASTETSNTFDSPSSPTPRVSRAAPHLCSSRPNASPRPIPTL